MGRLSVSVSIIIPVYNVLNYLGKCVKSVQQQTLQSIQIILVDDGSTDGSSGMCDQLTKSDPRIQVIHQKNQGLSAARNIGLTVATGEYVAFLDSDDYWKEPKALEEMLELLQQSSEVLDVILFSYCKTNLKTNKERFFLLPALPIASTFNQKIFLLKNRAYSNSACTKLFRRDFLIENKLWFPLEIKSEDLAWSRRVLTTMHNFMVYPKIVMVYQTNRNGSISTSFDERNFNDIVTQIREEIFLLEDCGEPTKKLGYAFWAEQIVWFLGYWPGLDKPMRHMVKEQADVLKLLSYGVNKRCKLICRLVHVFGPVVVIRLLNLYLRILRGF